MNILVYDNNAELKDLYREILKPMQAEMVFIDRLQEAKEEALYGSYNLLIWDIGFPKMDGLLAAERLVKDFPDQLVILVCGVPVNQPALDSLLKLPFHGIISKPFDIQRLRRMVQRAYRNSKTAYTVTLPMGREATLRPAV